MNAITSVVRFVDARDAINGLDRRLGSSAGQDRR
jgi:hypothetical protein